MARLLSLLVGAAIGLIPAVADSELSWKVSEVSIVESTGGGWEVELTFLNIGKEKVKGCLKVSSYDLMDQHGAQNFEIITMERIKRGHIWNRCSSLKLKPGRSASISTHISTVGSNISGQVRFHVDVFASPDQSKLLCTIQTQYVNLPG